MRLNFGNDRANSLSRTPEDHLPLPADAFGRAAFLWDTQRLALTWPRAHLTGRERLDRVEGLARANEAEWPDLADVRGQEQARRALEIAAAGGHSLLILRPYEPNWSSSTGRFQV